MVAWRSIVALLLTALAIAMMIAYPLRSFWSVTYTIDSTQGESSFTNGTSASIIYGVDRIRFYSQFGEDRKVYDQAYNTADPAYKIIQSLDSLMGIVFPLLVVMFCTLLISMTKMTTSIPSGIAKNFRRLFVLEAVLAFVLLLASMLILLTSFPRDTQAGQMSAKLFPGSVVFPQYQCGTNAVVIGGKVFQELSSETLDRCTHPSVNERYLVPEANGIATVWVYQNVAGGFWMCFLALMAATSILIVIFTDATFNSMFPMKETVEVAKPSMSMELEA